ncbi:hypothetical protein E3N88_39839 [Mikania micrantha]|uniref:Uncharacterized protein n=1 Tax=Mikania micrantha TaxID=192012 RepID=A0A5N6LKX5_9ASTR|nr:hypothetical protein E3N88_39839 [Mikania micrantha]
MRNSKGMNLKMMIQNDIMARSSTGGGRGKGRDSDHDSCRPRITGRLHSNAYEALSEHESSDDEESTVGRRGPVAPTPLHEPRNCEWIWIRHDQPCGAIYGRVRKMSLAKMPIGFQEEKILGFIGGKHTLGSQAYVTLKLKADEKLRRPTTVDELWMPSHGRKGTRPLDRLLRRERGEGSKEPEEINFQDNVEWVDAKAKESFKYVIEKYGDNTRKHPLFDLDTWIQAWKKKGRFDISDPQVMMTGTQSTLGTSTYLPARNEEPRGLLVSRLLALPDFTSLLV